MSKRNIKIESSLTWFINNVIIARLSLIIATLFIVYQPITASQDLQITRYDRALHSTGVRDILNQTTPEGMSYNYLVGNPDYIVDTALTNEKYKGDVLYDAKKKRVAGFVVCSSSHNRRHSNDQSRWWYVDWLALHQDYQGNACSSAVKKSYATQLWEQVIHDATGKKLPIMLNTLHTNKRMQDWCTRRGMCDEGPPSQSFLKYYSYQAHLQKPQEIERPNDTQKPVSTVSQSDLPIPNTQATIISKSKQQQSSKGSWLYRYRYKLAVGASIVTGCLLFAAYKYHYFTVDSRKAKS